MILNKLNLGLLLGSYSKKNLLNNSSSFFKIAFPDAIQSNPPCCKCINESLKEQKYS